MKEFRICIRSFAEVREFVSLATVQPFPVTVGSGAFSVNAKSFIGMVNLDFSNPLQVRCDCDNEGYQQFRQQLGRFLAKG